MFTRRNTDIFLMQYNSNGTRVWTKMLRTSYYDYGYAAAVDNAGYLYVAGAVSGTIRGETFAEGIDPIFMKYSTNGNIIWTKLTGSVAN